jgi:hypothetical protein
MVDAPVALVEGAGVPAVQVAHPLVEVRLRRLDHEVVVIPHQAADVQAPAVALLDAAEQMDEGEAILVVEDDGQVVVAAGDDVVDGAGLEVPVAAAHRATVAARMMRRCGRYAFGTAFARRRDVPDTRRGLQRRGASGRRGYAATLERSRCWCDGQ